MKYISKIQIEFLKEARDWNKLSLEEQKAYLKRHPASKRKLTAKPDKVSELKEKLESKKEDASLPKSNKKISLDYVNENDQDLSKLRAAAEKYNLKITKQTPNGSGGWPEFTFNGNYDNIKNFLKWYDPEAGDDFISEIKDEYLHLAMKLT